MGNLVKEVLDVAKEIAPDSLLVKTIDAALNTAEDPNAANIVADLELAHQLLMEFRDKISGLHPSVANIFKVLF